MADKEIAKVVRMNFPAVPEYFDSSEGKRK